MSDFPTHRDFILRCASANDSHRSIVRKLYFLSTSCAFHDQQALQLTMYDEICSFLDVPIGSVRIVGSGHAGFSLVKGTPFDPLRSDLDVAIVDPSIYLRLFEEAFELTDGWRQVARFGPFEKAHARREDFLRYLRKGVVRPDLLPSSVRKEQWLNFFGKLSDKYQHFCRRITAGVYATESFLAAKQESALRTFLESEKTR